VVPAVQSASEGCVTPGFLVVSSFSRASHFEPISWQQVSAAEYLKLLCCAQTDHGIESHRSRVRRGHAPVRYLMTIPSAAFSSGLPIQYSYLAAMRMRCWRSSAVGGFPGAPALTGLPISRKNLPSLRVVVISCREGSLDAFCQACFA